MPGAERHQVETARAQDQDLPNDCDLYPPLHGRLDLFEVARSQRLAQQTVIEAVLNGESQYERNQAET